MKKENKNNNVIISVYQENDLYFSVGVSNSSHKIVKIALPQPDKEQAINEVAKYYPDFEVSDKYEELAKSMAKLYNGEKVDFNLELLDFEVDEYGNKKSPVNSLFERKVLLETAKIPCGQVKTYKYIAEKLGNRAYRAVGTALGRNPFPIIIPCHRVVKSDLSVGQYGGGSKMKIEILKNEGVRIKGDKIVGKC